MNKEKIQAGLELISEGLDDEEELDIEDIYEDDDEPEDVTDECEVDLGTDSYGGIRMYLTHNGHVITRAGLGKVLELTDYAESAGYELVATGTGTKRGSYFRVLKY